jgi:photosystem II stability/assembly factor-like uncharacterized protein
MTRPPNDRDRELDALLRQPGERLSPPDGSWAHVTKRARRRKWVKASLSLAAVVVVIAGAVPAIIAVRSNSNDQKLIVSNGAHRTSTTSNLPVITPTTGVKPTKPTVVTASSAPAPTSSTPSTASTFTAASIPTTPLPVGYFPESLSFVSGSTGYLWGSVPGSAKGVVALTTNGGHTWNAIASPPVDNSFKTGSASSGDAQIRFVSGTLGFIFGAKTYVTRDGGASWQPYNADGYVDDLEALHQHFWALVRPSYHSSTARLYTATSSDPTLQPVNGVSPVSATTGTAQIAGGDSIALDNSTVDVLAGDSAFYSSPDEGVTWAKHASPCRTKPLSGLVTAPSTNSVIAVCGYNAAAGSESKQVYTSTNAGKTWTPTKNPPNSNGYVQTLTAGPTGTFIIGQARGGAQASFDGGKTWQPDLANGRELSFVGFIQPTVVIGLADRADESQGAFATSGNSGRSWSVTPFAK